MTLQLTVIGLDRIGISLGLSLEDYKSNVFRCGFDPNNTKIKKADTLVAFDKVFHRLSEAVREADAVIYALPVDQIEDTLKELSENLKPGCTIINTTPAITYFAEMAKKYLSPDQHPISMIPTLNGIYLHENEADAEIPHADLFKNAEVLIPTDHETKSEAVRLVTDLLAIFGARPCFIDPMEAEGILAKTEILPRMTAYALLLTTMGQPGWQDARKITSITYAKACSAKQGSEDQTHPSALPLSNRQNMLFALDGMMASLGTIRNLIEAGDQKALDHLLSDLRENHTEWVDLRTSGDWDAPRQEEPGKSTSLLGRLFGDPSKLKKK